MHIFELISINFLLLFPQILNPLSTSTSNYEDFGDLDYSIDSSGNMDISLDSSVQSNSSFRSEPQQNSPYKKNSTVYNTYVSIKLFFLYSK